MQDLLLSRIGENFDGECHLTEAEARAIHAEIEHLQSQLNAATEALTPSTSTKAAYIGEFTFNAIIGVSEEGSEEVVRVTVPWMTVKEIMAAIRDRAALKTVGSMG